MFKRPSGDGFFTKQKKQSPEEKAFVKIIREQCRQDMINEFVSAFPEQIPSERDIEGSLDVLIDQLRSSGQLQQMLDQYLQEKIADERARFGSGQGK